MDKEWAKQRVKEAQDKCNIAIMAMKYACSINMSNDNIIHIAKVIVDNANIIEYYTPDLEKANGAQ